MVGGVGWLDEGRGEGRGRGFAGLGKEAKRNGKGRRYCAGERGRDWVDLWGGREGFLILMVKFDF